MIVVIVVAVATTTTATIVFRGCRGGGIGARRGSAEP